MSMVARLSRRLLAGVVVGCGLSWAALVGTAAAATTTIGVGGATGSMISPGVMGSDYLQPFGGMGSFSSTTHQFDPSFLAALTDDSFAGSIRFPGGIAADFYHWQRAIGPQSQRTDNAYGPNTGPDPSTVGPDEFGQLLDATGASGVMTTNFSTGTAAEAAGLVSYMTGSSGTFAAQRAANGHPQPYNVPMWEVGNEEQSAANSWRNGTFVSLGGTPGDPAPAASSPCAGATAATAGIADCEYIYGGTTSFSAQPVVTFADRTAAAADSTGAASQSFFVKYPPVASGSKTISVGGTQWTEVSSLAGVGPNAEDYTIDDTTGEITFGNGTHGAIPAKGAQITASYQSGPHDGFAAYYKAMKAANPNIQVCATDTDMAFITDAGSAVPYDCLQYHPYETATDSSGNISGFEKSVMNAPANELATLQMWQSAIQRAAGHAIPLELSEYGSLIGDTPDASLVPFYYDSLDEALLNASQLATWINAGVSVADRQLLAAETPATANVGVGLPGGAPFATTGAIVTPGPNAVGPDVVADPAVAEPTAQYFQLFHPLAGGALLATTTSNNPTLSTLKSNGQAVGDLSVVAALTTDGKTAAVVINRSPTDSVQTQLTLSGAAANGQAAVTTLNAANGGDALTFNTSASPSAVSTTSSQGIVQNGTLPLTFPAHSISLVEVTPSPPVSSPPPPPSAQPPPVANISSAAPPVTPKAKRVTRLTIGAIKLAGAKVTWCKKCTYPKTKLQFTLSKPAKVRIVLLAEEKVAKRAKAKIRYTQVAVVTVAGHKGVNTFLVGKRWHKRLRPGTTMEVRVQLRSGKAWKTHKTLKLTVRRPRV